MIIPFDEEWVELVTQQLRYSDQVETLVEEVWETEFEVS